MNYLIKALQFASIKHKTQVRKGTQEPYINHPIDLISILNLCNINDEITLCIALLHDTLEDTNTSFEELEKIFNKEIAKGVLLMSDNKTLPKSQRKKLQIEHNTKDLPTNVQMVKIADKISNIRNISKHPPKNWEIDRTISFVLWCKAVVDSIKDCNENLYDMFENIYAIEMSRLLPEYVSLTVEQLHNKMAFQLSDIDLKNEKD